MNDRFREPLAVVGMACRLPGAPDPRNYWRMLLEGRTAIGEPPAGRFGSERGASWRGGYLGGVDGFDARAFRLIPREARSLDPQHRLLLELAWEALEDAGIPVSGNREGRAGVFVAVQWNDYLRRLARDPARLDGYALSGNSTVFAANRISHALDLPGPSLTFDAGCASGLVAVHEAAKSLWLGDCDFALAGAVELALSPEVTRMLASARILSESGECRPLDARADGFLRGEGGGILVLKTVSSLSPADRVYALLTGIASAHHGREEWLTAPSGRGVEEAVRQACRVAGVRPTDLDYVELHATGSSKGDRIEAEALGRVAGRPAGRDRPLAIGSVKSSLGHLGPAAGIAGLVKTILSLFHGKVPPMRGPERVSPDIPLDDLGLRVQREAGPWPRGPASALAGVTAISMGGVEAHAVLAAPPARPVPPAGPRGGSLFLPLSARSGASLAALARSWADFLRESVPGSPTVEDVSYTACAGRAHHEHRRIVAGRTKEEIAAALDPAPAGGQGIVEDPRLGPIARAYLSGRPVEWGPFLPAGARVASLPPYAWERKRHWAEGLDSEPPPPGATETDGFRARLERVPVSDRSGLLVARVAGRAAALLGQQAEAVDPSRPLTLIGLDSFSAAELSRRLEEDAGVRLGLAELLHAATPEAIARALLSGTPSDPRASLAPDPENRHEPFDLTPLQEAYWIGRAEGMELGGVGCHYYQEFEGAGIDPVRLESSFRRVIERQDMLRCVVETEGRQRVLPEVPPYRIEVSDLSGLAPAAVSAGLERIREEMARRVYAADRWPLFDVRATILPGGRVRVHLSFDLLPLDAESLSLLIDQWGREYHEPGSLAPLSISFRDVVVADRAERQKDRARRDRAYWEERIPTLPPAPRLPARRGGPGPDPTLRRRYRGELGHELWAGVKSVAARAALTPSAVLVAAFADVVGAWSGRDRFAINLTYCVRPRSHPEIARILGDFTTTVLVEVDLSPASFGERARATGERLAGDLDHSSLGGVEVIRALRRQRGEPASAAAMPIVLTSLLGGGEARSARIYSPNWLGDPVWGTSQTPQVSFDHQGFEEGGRLLLHWDVVEAEFPEGVVAAMLSAYVAHLSRLAGGEAAWREAWRPGPPPEEVVRRPSAGPAACPAPDRLLHQPFEDQARRRPEAVAVSDPRGSLTYGELDRISLSLAHRLRAAGARPGELVAIVMEKGWEEVAAALAILRAGPAYLPIEAELPPARIESLLEHGQARLALVPSRTSRALPLPGGVKPVVVDRSPLGGLAPEPLGPAQGPGDLAYVIYTSGSTGRPKGVMIEHRSAANTIADVNRRFRVEKDDRVLALSSLAFDLSVWDIFGTLAAGGTIVLPAPGGMRDPEHWTDRIARERVTIWNSVPALLRMLVEHEGPGPDPRLSTLRLALLSGDWIPVALPDAFRARVPGIELVSLGGATEASIWSILRPIGEVDPSWPSIPYGRPMDAQTVDVLDARFEPCPDWVPGEIFLGGVGLARGYWRDPEETARRFAVRPGTGERLYRTGDLGRWLPEGEVELLGRIDFQVKIQGHRIELGEVEHAMLAHPGVRAAVAAAREDRSGARRLVGYFVPRDPGGDPAELARSARAFLEERLPRWMVPAVLVALDEIPLSRNGKVDRSRLPAPRAGEDAPPAGSTPGGPLEDSVLEIVREVLAAPHVRAGDRFVDLGVASLQIVQIHARLRSRLGASISVAAMFEHPTPAHLARAIEGSAGRGAWAPETGRSPRAPFVRRQLEVRREER